MVCGFYLFDYVTATMERATETSTETATAKASDILPFGFFFAASSYYVSLNTVSSFVYITPRFFMLEPLPVSCIHVRRHTVLNNSSMRYHGRCCWHPLCYTAAWHFPPRICLVFWLRWNARLDRQRWIPPYSSRRWGHYHLQIRHILSSHSNISSRTFVLS